MNAPTPLLQLQAQVQREARGSGGPVKGLMTWLLDRRNLEAGFDRVRAADGANTPGSDGVTAAAVESQAGTWLTRLAEDLMHDRYRPAPPRRFEVPKKPGSNATRTLGILNLRDRVVHAGFKQILEPILEPLFLPGSHGFRPGRSVSGALGEATRLLSPPVGDGALFRAAVPLDVADCFDTIDHLALRDALARLIDDEPLLALFDRLLRAGGTEVSRWFRRHWCGLVQGSSLSPMLCNLALHPLDEALAELGRANEGGVVALRYADDLLVLARDEGLVRQAVAVAAQTLARLRQRLRRPIALCRPLEQGVPWLGVHLRPRPHRWLGNVRFGYVVPDAKVQGMLERVVEMTLPPSARIDASAFNLGRWLVSINEQLRDWRQAYLYADNAAEVFAALDEHTRERVAQLLHAVTGKRFQTLRAEYRVRLPRGFWTWKVNGCALVVLSSLAPHAPENLTRRPPWMRVAPQPIARPTPKPAGPAEEHIP